MVRTSEFVRLVPQATDPSDWSLGDWVVFFNEPRPLTELVWNAAIVGKPDFSTLAVLSTTFFNARNIWLSRSEAGSSCMLPVRSFSAVFWGKYRTPEMQLKPRGMPPNID